MRFSQGEILGRAAVIEVRLSRERRREFGTVVNGGGIMMHHARRPGGPVAAAQKCAIFLPLYVFCGRHLLLAQLRPANIDGARGARNQIRRIVAMIRERWPNVAIVLRGDSGFARESSPCPMPALTKTSSSRPTPPWRPHNRNSPPQQGKGGNAAAAMTPACPKPTKNQSYAEPVQLSRPEYPSQSPTHHADTQISPITLKSSASKTPREKSGKK